MSTPEENYDIAVDTSTDGDSRERAIDGLKAANECQRLGELVRMSELDERFQRQALTAVATSQCASTLRNIVEEATVDDALLTEARGLLADLDEDDDAQGTAGRL